ncbi:MAG: GxxExxY protein [Bacteroidota bacterium]
MEVHKQLGCGFREAVYQEALEMEFIENAMLIRHALAPVQTFHPLVILFSFNINLCNLCNLW